jgi:hypothetical protein
MRLHMITMFLNAWETQDFGAVLEGWLSAEGAALAPTHCVR